jgi:hypothetical protein
MHSNVTRQESHYLSLILILVVGAQLAAQQLAGAGDPVLVQKERDSWVIEDAPVNHLARASEALTTGDPRAAATELHTAALFLKAEAANADDSTKWDLVNDAAELEGAAFCLNHATDNASREATNTVAQTYLRLARNRWEQALTAHATEDAAAMRRHIAAAGDLLEKHLETAGKAIDQATQKLLAEARDAGHQAEATSRQAAIGFGELLKSLGQKIEQNGGANSDSQHQPAHDQSKS